MFQSRRVRVWEIPKWIMEMFRVIVRPTTNTPGVVPGPPQPEWQPTVEEHKL